MVSEGGARAVFLDRDGVLAIPEFHDGRSFAPQQLAEQLPVDAIEVNEHPNRPDCIVSSLGEAAKIVVGRA